jgi:peptidyl-prolyl cis-trans isomerase B (cyclophilin B)
MIQGGGYDEKFGEKEADAIYGEFITNGWKQNDIRHTRGVLSMARTSYPDSASSQFFVMHKDSPHLDAQYAAFGKVTEGLDVIDKIANVKTGMRGRYMQDVPVENVVIDKIEVVG